MRAPHGPWSATRLISRLGSNPGPRLTLCASLCLATAACGQPSTSDSSPTEIASALTAPTTPQSYLVGFDATTIPAEAEALVAAAGGTIVARYANVGALLARSSLSSFANALRAAPGVSSVGAVSAVHSAINPVQGNFGSHHRGSHRAHRAAGDPLAFRQWDMDQIHAPQAHAVFEGNRSVLVGVIDSGVDVTHPDLVGQVDAAASASCLGGVPNPDPAVWATDIIGHGTHVSGTIAGAKNGVGIVGVAPRARVAAVKVIVDDVNDPNFGLVFPDAVVCAIDWGIDHGFDLMNASLVIDPFTGPVDDIFCSDQPDRAAVVAIVRRAIQAAARKKIALIAAAGNFFTDLSTLQGTAPGSTCKVLPVQLPKVIGVSSVGFTKLLGFYSNYGFGAVDLTGPGGDGNVADPDVIDTISSGQVLSSVPPDSLYYQLAAQWDGQVQDCTSGTCSTYAYLQGTSQAAPHVTGVAALIVSRFGRLPPDVLLGILSLTAKPIPCPVGPYNPGMAPTPAICQGPPLYNSFYGAGEIDALAVVR